MFITCTLMLRIFVFVWLDEWFVKIMSVTGYSFALMSSPNLSFSLIQNVVVYSRRPLFRCITVFEILNIPSGFMCSFPFFFREYSAVWIQVSTPRSEPLEDPASVVCVERFGRVRSTGCSENRLSTLSQRLLSNWR